MIIAIDGPAAAGKGTLARRIAATLNLPYLDTGILYRATAKRVLDSGASPADTDAALTAAKSLGQTDLNRSDLRDPATSLAASQVAAIPAVRQALLEFQRNFGTTHGAVLDGRDIGTVIFPGAEVKLFVTASVPARAQRRHTELRARGEDVSLEDVTADLQARDEADSKRATAPLVPAPDATIFDTTEMDIETAFIRALELIRGKTT